MLSRARKKRRAAVAVAGIVAAIATGCAPSTPAASTGTVVDFHDLSATIGVGRIAQVEQIAEDGHGHLVGVSVVLQDTNSASDGGYMYHATAVFGETRTYVGGTYDVACSYPIAQIRARAVLGSAAAPYQVGVRADSDQYIPANVTQEHDLTGAWDFDNGDRPTIIVESVTVDFEGTPYCE